MSESTSAAAPIRLEAGTPAPDFTLLDQKGTPTSLSSFRGSKVILYFYGEANTPACTQQACDFNEDLSRFSDEGFQVIGVSRDELPAIQKMVDEQHLTFPLLADPERVAHDAYGTFGQKQMYGRTVTGVIRATFVIDENGIITMPLYNIKATGHVKMLRKKLKLAV